MSKSHSRRLLTPSTLPRPIRPPPPLAPRTAAAPVAVLTPRLQRPQSKAPAAPCAPLRHYLTCKINDFIIILQQCVRVHLHGDYMMGVTVCAQRSGHAHALQHTPRRSLTPGPAIQRRALSLCQGGQRTRHTRSAQRCTPRVSPQSRWMAAAALIGRSCCTAGNHTNDSDAAAASQKKQRCSACRSARTRPTPSGHPGIEMRELVTGCPAIPMLQLERTMGAASRCDCMGRRTREGWRAPA